MKKGLLILLFLPMIGLGQFGALQGYIGNGKFLLESNLVNCEALIITKMDQDSLYRKCIDSELFTGYSIEIGGYLAEREYDGQSYGEYKGFVIRVYENGLLRVLSIYDSLGNFEDEMYFEESGDGNATLGNIDAIEEEYEYTNYWENGNKKDEGTRIWGGRNYEKEINIGFRTEYYNNGIIKRVSFYEFDAEDNINRATYLSYSICFDKNGRQKECE